jgi:branched-chain amino acid transport system permease protein
MEKITLTSQLIQYLITGLTVGSIYAMVAIGFNIIYNVTEIINLAQGEFVMLGGLIMVSLHVGAGLPIILAFPLTIIFVTVVGLLLGRVAAGSVGHSSHTSALGPDADYCNDCRFDHHQRHCHVCLGQGSL